MHGCNKLWMYMDLEVHSALMQTVTLSVLIVEHWPISVSTPVFIRKLNPGPAEPMSHAKVLHWNTPTPALLYWIALDCTDMLCQWVSVLFSGGQGIKSAPCHEVEIIWMSHFTHTCPQCDIICNFGTSTKNETQFCGFERCRAAQHDVWAKMNKLIN